MMTAVKQAKPDKTRTLFRVAYVLFLLLVVYRLINGEVMEAASCLGIALIFDPFAPAKWEERKVWQKAWLVMHATIVCALFAAGFILK
jgi:glycerol uptake facilitator-like aquaporin